MVNTKRRSRSPSKAILRMLLDHQRWLSSDGSFGKQLDREDLVFVDCDLDGLDLTNAALGDARFVRGSARGARFTNADLSGAFFDSCDVAGADFTSAHLGHATFLDANHETARFDGATMLGTVWSREEFTKAVEAAYRPDAPKIPPRLPRRPSPG